MSTLVSVVIPVYNGERFLREAVDSVLNQKYSPVEIIIVDDGSTDATAKVARNLPEPVRYLHQANQGPAAARNRGIERAQGSLLAFADADDLWPADKLERQLPYLINDPAVDIVMGRIQQVLLSETADGQTQSTDFAEPAFSVNLGSAIIRKSVFERVGLFDETMRYSEDVDWFMRAREAGAAIKTIDAVTLFYRQHEQNMTRGKTTSELNVLKALKKSLDRRRERTGAAAALPTFKIEE
ncbi:MAG TPA: glycosyltransferase family A protein [Pyrinomonadaceae bacterium]|nr:glycosyltransferase family A protein [Pyrinomonadaceae bacterium]